MKEIWKVAPYFPSYEISSMGRVRRSTSTTNTWAGRIRKLQLIGRKGAEYPALFHRQSEKYVKVHHLVLLAFVGPCPVGHVASHANDKKTDNRLCNLSWTTRSENDKQAFRNGHRISPVVRKLNLSKVATIRKLIRKGVLSRSEIGKRFNVNRATVNDIHWGRTWVKKKR